jgi:hypothetical protein
MPAKHHRQRASSHKEAEIHRLPLSRKRRAKTESSEAGRRGPKSAVRPAILSLTNI